ncbi:unnamed protein product, partial [Didymodactylos carnosus]
AKRYRLRVPSNLDLKLKILHDSHDAPTCSGTFWLLQDIYVHQTILLLVSYAKGYKKVRF